MEAVSPVLTAGAAAPALAAGAAAPRPPTAGAPFDGALAQVARAAERQSVGKAFEAAVLTSFVADVLPPEESPVWGGSGGTLWRGLFAEHLAEAVAASGGIGIAGLVDRTLAHAGEVRP